MKLSISVMAHPSRQEFFEYLKSKLGDVPFSIDTGFGIIENCKRAWLMYDPTADYHVVIQDDAIICDDFYNRAIEVLKKADKKAVSFFHVSPISYNKHRQEAKETGAIVQPGLSGGVALCIPTDFIKPMIKHYDGLKFPCDDHRVGNFLITKNIPIYYPIPSLIDHRVGNMSVMWKKPSKHRANEYIDREKNPQ